MNATKKVLFIVHHRRDRSPGQRFRFEQYTDYLKAHGFECDEALLLDEQDDKVFYKPGNLFGKFFVLAKATIRRLRDIIRAREYDLIFLFREAFMLGNTFFERFLTNTPARVIFDFDDAIWLDNVSDGNRKFAFLKDASKTGRIIEMCDMVFAGNQYLYDYALRYNSVVRLVPTTIDTNLYVPKPKHESNVINIGWSGSITTIQYFNFALPALIKLKANYGNLLYFTVIGDGNYRVPELGLVGKAWCMADEIPTLETFDIGIMPVPDTPWTRGKCGLKCAQYMAFETPTVVSPVGINTTTDYLDGINCMVARTEQEWYDKLAFLIENPDKRRTIGQAGRAMIVEKYSVLAWRDKYVEYFNEALNLPKW